MSILGVLGTNPSTSTMRVGQIPDHEKQNKSNRRLSISYEAFSCLKMTTQDRHRTEKTCKANRLSVSVRVNHIS